MPKPEPFRLPSRSSIKTLEFQRSQRSGNTGAGVGAFFKQVTRTRVASFCISSYSYDPTELVLIIEFRARGTYQYEDVPIWEVTALGFAGSRGKYFNENIRGKYNYERIG